MHFIIIGVAEKFMGCRLCQNTLCKKCMFNVHENPLNVSQFTPHALLNRSRFTKPVSRFTKLASRFTKPVSRFTKPVSRFTKSASRFSLYRCPD